MKSPLIQALLLLFSATATLAQSPPIVNLTAKRLDEKADAFLQAGKNDSAVAAYTAWLAASPRDNVAWYNLACALAKSNQLADAGIALANAARTGFTQSDAAKKDDDLAAIRTTQAFAEGLRLMDSVAATNRLPDMERRYLPSHSIGTYVALLPPDYTANPKKTYTFCVVLQGASGNEVEFAKLAQQFGRDGMIYIVPRAPYPNFQATAQYGSNRYIASFPDELPGWAEVDPVYYGYLDFIAACIADAREHFRVTPGPGLLFGQSQGAMFANIFALNHPDLIKAYIAHAAPFASKHFLTDDRFAALKAAGTKVTLIQSTEDNGVPFEHSKKMQAAYLQHNIPVELIETKGGHYPAPETIAKIRSWMDSYRK